MLFTGLNHLHYALVEHANGKDAKKKRNAKLDVPRCSDRQDAPYGGGGGSEVGAGKPQRT